jgi:hypothetical protein
MMSIAGEQDGLAVELSGHLRLMKMDKEPIEEYWEGDPPRFLIREVQEVRDVESEFLVITSTGKRFRVKVEVV